MGDDVLMTAPGCNPSHLILYPLPHVDYSSTPTLNIDRLMQHVCNSSSMAFSIQDVMKDAEQYRRTAADRVVGGISVPSSVTGNVANPAIRKILAGSAAAAEAAAAAFKLKPVAESPRGAEDQTAAAAAAAAGTAAAAAGGVRGLTLPTLEPEQQQQMPAQQQLLMFLRRRLLPLRVAARRIATAEVWAQHVSAQQLKRQHGTTAAAAAAEGGASGATAVKVEGTSSDAAAAAAAADTAADGGASQGTPNGLPATAAAAAADGGDGGGVSPRGAAAAAGDEWQRELQGVLQQQQGQIVARCSQLLMQQPLALSDLLAAFQQDHFPASQQLNIQVRGAGGGGGVAGGGHKHCGGWR
jgi:hypothetical protein